jgi:hypothetical protein
MPRCLCIKNDGQQCTREAIKKSGQNPQFCWQHQKCQKKVQPQITKEEKKKPIHVKPKTQQKIEPVKSIKQKESIPVKPPKSKEYIPVKPIIPFTQKHHSQNLRVLSGPISFIFFPNVNGKKILLLGDYHTNKYLCTEKSHQDQGMPDGPSWPVYDVHQWLGDLAKNAPECLDVFLETQYLLPYSQTGGKPLKDYENNIEAIEDEFKICLTPIVNVKEKCYSNKLRFHYIDVRLFSEKNIIYNPFVPISQKPNIDRQKLSKQIENVLSRLMNEKYNKKTLYSYLLGIDKNDMTEAVFHDFIFELYQLMGVPINYRGLKEYMELYFQKIDKELAKMHHSIDKDEFLNTLLEIYLEPNKSPMNIIGITMDIYFLSRLFIVFDQNKMNRGPVGCRNSQYQQIKNAIVYAGALHIDIYSEFLKKYFTVDPKIDIKQPYNNQCIKLDPPFDFFAEFKH